MKGTKGGSATNHPRPRRGATATTQITSTVGEAKRTDETRTLEHAVKDAWFHEADAWW